MIAFIWDCWASIRLSSAFRSTHHPTASATRAVSQSRSRMVNRRRMELPTQDERDDAENSEHKAKHQKHKQWQIATACSAPLAKSYASHLGVLPKITSWFGRLGHNVVKRRI